MSGYGFWMMSQAEKGVGVMFMAMLGSAVHEELAPWMLVAVS